MKLFRWILLPIASMILIGCSTVHTSQRNLRAFDFERDTLAYANELKWTYSFENNGAGGVIRPVDPAPDYALHCFVVTRTARQFLAHARFDPSLPPPDNATTRRLIGRIVRRSDHTGSDSESRIVLPGFGDLKSFSRVHESLLKAETGGAWRSYLQRGNWRMVFPFSRRHQERLAQTLQQRLSVGWPPIVHIVRFPSLTINHALLIYGCAESDEAIEFRVYDPNQPGKPALLTFDRRQRTFHFARNEYFRGGRVDAYEIYRNGLF